jgi:hypothetical protein
MGPRQSRQYWDVGRDIGLASICAPAAVTSQAVAGTPWGWDLPLTHWLTTSARTRLAARGDPSRHALRAQRRHGVFSLIRTHFHQGHARPERVLWMLKGR